MSIRCKAPAAPCWSERGDCAMRWRVAPSRYGGAPVTMQLFGGTVRLFGCKGLPTGWLGQGAACVTKIWRAESALAKDLLRVCCAMWGRVCMCCVVLRSGMAMPTTHRICCGQQDSSACAAVAGGGMIVA